MAITLVSHSLFLLQAACFIVLAAYPFTRSSTFARAMEGRASSNEILILILPFGGLSVFGSVIGILPSVDRPLSEVLINVRDPGPMVAGLGAGLIGTAFRATEQSITTPDGSPNALLAGAFSSLVLLKIRRFPRLFYSVAFAILYEIFHMATMVALSEHIDLAMDVVNASALPMIQANTTGM